MFKEWEGFVEGKWSNDEIDEIFREDFKCLKDF